MKKDFRSSSPGSGNTGITGNTGRKRAKKWFCRKAARVLGILGILGTLGESGRRKVWTQFRPGSEYWEHWEKAGEERFCRKVSFRAPRRLSVLIRTHPYPSVLPQSILWQGTPPPIGSAVPRRKLLVILVIPVIPVPQPVLWKCPFAPRLRRPPAPLRTLCTFPLHVPL